MDSRVHRRRQLLAALAAVLPPELQAHADARALFDPSAPDGSGEAAAACLSHALGLTAAEQAALALALWVESDAHLAAALCLLQGNAQHSGPPRPTLGLLARLAAGLDEDRAATGGAAMAGLLQGSALASGLLQLAAEPQQLAHAQTLRVAPALLPLLLATATGLPPAHGLSLGRLGLEPLASTAWPLPRAWAAAAEALARWAAAADAAGNPCALVVRGADRDEQHTFAQRLAQLLGRHAMAVSGQEESLQLSADTLALLAAREPLVPALLLCRALPVWHAGGAPGQTQRIPALPHWGGPLLVLAGGDGAFESSQPMQEFELTLPDPADRLALWQALRVDGADADAVARSRCGLAVLARAAAAAAVPADAAIEAALRSSARGLAAWAQVSRDRIPADAWVGPAEVHRDLGLLLTRCLARHEASRSLGPLLRGRLAAGVKALFIGASGTGKTLAAQWLADRLARPLLRVDLASVVSKYIGETEKNLAQLLARAEHLDAVLLFDEADSLFGARTDVRQANDRYANMQTNYLLQRLETFAGVALLTSNSKARFDDAFVRRLDAVVEFPLPDVGERRRLWSLHLGDAPALDAGWLNHVAALVDLPGGHIRNAALTAALLARRRGGEAEAVAAADLREALALEYRKLGQRPPDSL